MSWVLLLPRLEIVVFSEWTWDCAHEDSLCCPGLRLCPIGVQVLSELRRDQDLSSQARVEAKAGTFMKWNRMCVVSVKTKMTRDSVPVGSLSIWRGWLSYSLGTASGLQGQVAATSWRLRSQQSGSVRKRFKTKSVTTPTIYSGPTRWDKLHKRYQQSFHRSVLIWIPTHCL